VVTCILSEVVRPQTWWPNGPGKESIMDSSYRFINTDGSEVTRELTDGLTLGDILAEGQKGLVNGKSEGTATTIRNGDTIEVFAKSAKAGEWMLVKVINIA